MKNISLTNRVLDHIENVRDWLARAEADYQNGEDWQGELNLNLAQAELKKAWEESRKLHSAETNSNVVTFPPRQAPAKSAAKKGFALRFRHQSGLVAGVVLLLLLNLTLFSHPETVSEQFAAVEVNPGGALPEAEATAELQAAADVQLMSAANIAKTAEAPVQKEAAKKAVPVHKYSYDSMPVHFEVKKDSLVNNPTEEVKSEKSRSEVQVTSAKNQPNLVSRKLQTSGKGVDQYAASKITLVSSKTTVQEITTVKYDLDTLVDLAETALTVKR